MMWRQETGFLEMFLSYYWQFERQATSARGYRDFLFDVLSVHERSQTYQEPPAAGSPLQVSSRDVDAGLKDWRPENDIPHPEISSPPPRKRRLVEDTGVDDSAVEVKEEPESWNAQEEYSENDGFSQYQRTGADAVPLSMNFSEENDDSQQSNEEASNINQCRLFCNYCDFASNTVDELRLHVYCHEDRPHVCNECPLAFKTVHALKEHEQQHSTDLTFACDECGRRHQTRHALRKHKIMKHSSEEVFECQSCNRTFKNAENLSRHEALHKSDRPYICQFCDKSFTQRCYLKNHERIHTGDLPFKCNQCPRKFSNRTNCLAHMRMHTDERPFTCDVCGRAFSMMWILKRHKCNAKSNRGRSLKAIASDNLDVSEPCMQSQKTGDIPSQSIQKLGDATTLELPIDLEKTDDTLAEANRNASTDIPNASTPNNNSMNNNFDSHKHGNTPACNPFVTESSDSVNDSGILSSESHVAPNDVQQRISLPCLYPGSDTTCAVNLVTEPVAQRMSSTDTSIGPWARKRLIKIAPLSAPSAVSRNLPVAVGQPILPRVRPGSDAPTKGRNLQPRPNSIDPHAARFLDFAAQRPAIASGSPSQPNSNNRGPRKKPKAIAPACRSLVRIAPRPPNADSDKDDRA